VLGPPGSSSPTTTQPMTMGPPPGHSPSPPANENSELTSGSQKQYSSTANANKW